MVLMATVAHAQTPQEISLAAAVDIALEREPSLQAARAEVDTARAMRRQAGLRPNPSVWFERREERGGTDNQTTVEVSVPLELFRRAARMDAADRDIDVADRSAADRARMLVNEVKVKYGQATAAVRDRRVAGDLAASARRELELLARRVEEGASPPIERDLLDVEVRRLESARMRAAGRAEAALIALKRALGLQADAPVALRDTLEDLSSPAAAIESGAAGSRPDVLEAEARVDLADARIAQAQSEGRFDLTVTGAYMRMDAGFPQRGFGSSGDLERVRGLFTYASIGAMVMVPLWNRNQGGVAAARADRTAAAARLAAVRLTVEEEKAAALAVAREARNALAVMADAVGLAQRNLEVVRETFELGRGRLADVLTEQRRYLEIEQEYTEALREAFEARAALEFAQGELR
jgi:cobalt-zinc-cadmium efflux system outer membrane protein